MSENENMTIVAVSSADGSEVKSPQTLLDRLIGRISFDPMEFVGMNQADQAAELKRLIGLAFDDLDDQHRAKFDLRRDANRNVKNFEAIVERMERGEPGEVRETETIRARIKAHSESVGLWQRKCNEAQSRRSAVERLDQKIETKESEILKRIERITELKAAIAAEEANVAADRNVLKALAADRADAVTMEAAVVAEADGLKPQSSESLVATLDELNAHNARVKQHEDFKKLLGKLAKASGYQVWVERIAGGEGDSSFVIEDGAVEA